MIFSIHLIDTVPGYNNVDKLLVIDDNLTAAARAVFLEKYKVGITVKFGRYEQDNKASNGKEGIEWLVLANDGNTATLISRFALDCKPYNTEDTSVTWETCTLRKWLNNEFLQTAFTAEEQAFLKTVSVTADKNPDYSVYQGKDTQDKVFLLSFDEVNRYFTSDKDRICYPSAYATAQGASTRTDGSGCWWWLRSPGIDNNFAALIRYDGSVNTRGDLVDYANESIRPVVVVGPS